MNTPDFIKAQKIDSHFIKGLNEMMEAGYVICQKHREVDYFIYNYTAKAQYERVWNPITLTCRGLILDGNGKLIARPLPKFFNLEELDPLSIPNESFDVFEKMDGSMGILYFLNDQPYIATRGSFHSPQSQVANRILNEKYSSLFSKLNSDWTYLFEIIYPENRIVVDYGEMEDLVLLACVDKVTGEDITLPKIGFPSVRCFDGIKDFANLKAINEDNKEGFVIRFSSGKRMKIKFEEYCRLHKLLTQITSRTIWEILKEDQDLDEILDQVPDEFYDWVRKTAADLKQQFNIIEENVHKEFKTFDTRKETAAYFKTCTYPKILFKILDKRDYEDLIWRLIYPKHERPFNASEEN